MKQDELLILSTEAYSDFGFSGPYKVLKDFMFKEVVPIVESIKQDYGKPGPDAVTDWLLINGYIECVLCTEVHLGSYGHIEITGVTE